MLVLPYELRTFLRATSQIAVFAVALSAAGVQAEDKDVLAAASAFTQGQQAELSGNHERAAELFELANHIAPTPEALRSATRARLSAEQLTSAASDAEELLRLYPNDETSVELANDVLAKAKPELTRFTFACSQPCTVVVDGFAAGLAPLREPVVYVTPGSHEVQIGFAGDLKQSLQLAGVAGEARTVKVARPVTRTVDVSGQTAAHADSTSNRAALSQVWFWSAVGATAAAGAVTLWSGIDDRHARDDFKKSPSRAAFDDGEKKDRRTNALIGTTAALAVSAVVLGVFTDFDGSERRATAAVEIDPNGGARLFYSGRF